MAKKTKKPRKGGKYVCNLCGLELTVNEECGCVEPCDIVCCGTDMIQKKSRKK